MPTDGFPLAEGLIEQAYGLFFFDAAWRDPRLLTDLHRPLLRQRSAVECLARRLWCIRMRNAVRLGSGYHHVGGHFLQRPRRTQEVLALLATGGTCGQNTRAMFAWLNFGRQLACCNNLLIPFCLQHRGLCCIASFVVCAVTDLVN